MSDAKKSRKCEDCGHIFEYALWLSSCPNCRSSNLLVVDGTPPTAAKKAVHLVSDAHVVDPNRPIPQPKMIHNDDLLETHLEHKEDIHLVIDDDSQRKPSSALLHEVKLILDEDSSPHVSTMNMEEIQILIMEIEEEYRPDTNKVTEPSRPLTPEELAKEAVKKRLAKLKSASYDEELAPLDAPSKALAEKAARLKQVESMKNKDELTGLPPMRAPVQATEAPVRKSRLRETEETTSEPVATGRSFAKSRLQRPEGAEVAPPPVPEATAEAPTAGLSFGKTRLQRPEGAEVAPPPVAEASPQAEAPTTGLSFGKTRLQRPEGAEVAPPPVAEATAEAPTTGLSFGKTRLQRPEGAEVAPPPVPEATAEAPTAGLSFGKTRLQRPEGAEVAPPPVAEASPQAEAPTTGLSFGKTRLQRGETAPPPPEKKSFLSRKKKAEAPVQVAPPVQAPVKKKMFQNTTPMPPVHFEDEVEPNPPQTDFLQEEPVSSVGKREIIESKGKRELPEETAPVPVEEVQAEPVIRKRRFNLPPVDELEEDVVLAPITSEGKPVPPVQQEEGVVGLGKKPRLQPPPQEPAKKSLFKKKK